MGVNERINRALLCQAQRDGQIERLVRNNPIAYAVWRACKGMPEAEMLKVLAIAMAEEANERTKRYHDLLKRMSPTYFAAQYLRDNPHLMDDPNAPNP